jgi:hypothetical protein
VWSISPGFAYNLVRWSASGRPVVGNDAGKAFAKWAIDLVNVASGQFGDETWQRAFKECRLRDRENISMTAALMSSHPSLIERVPCRDSHGCEKL